MAARHPFGITDFHMLVDDPGERNLFYRQHHSPLLQHMDEGLVLPMGCRIQWWPVGMAWSAGSYLPIDRIELLS